MAQKQMNQTDVLIWSTDGWLIVYLLCQVPEVPRQAQQSGSENPARSWEAVVDHAGGVSDAQTLQELTAGHCRSEVVHSSVHCLSWKRLQAAAAAVCPHYPGWRECRGPRPVPTAGQQRPAPRGTRPGPSGRTLTGSSQPAGWKSSVWEVILRFCYRSYSSSGRFFQWFHQKSELKHA